MEQTYTTQSNVSSKAVIEIQKQDKSKTQNIHLHYNHYQGGRCKQSHCSERVTNCVNSTSIATCMYLVSILFECTRYQWPLNYEYDAFMRKTRVDEYTLGHLLVLPTVLIGAGTHMHA